VKLVRDEISFNTDLLALHAARPDRYPFLLESVADGTAQARWDILFACPGPRLVLDADWHLQDPQESGCSTFLGALDAWHEQLKTPVADSTLPFSGGWFIYLGYELAAEVEPGLPRQRPARLPVAVAVRVPAAIVRDRAARRAYIVAEQGSTACLAEISTDVSENMPLPATPRTILQGTVQEAPGEHFLEAVARAKAHIAAGDIFQANLSRRWAAQCRAGISPWMIYARLREANPAPFAGLACLGETAIISSSPERLFRIGEGQVETRPIAGTRARIGGGVAETALQQELLGHPKERAEHVMLIDLERNDLGRICVPGSVEVDQFMSIESYAHVHHIVSNVRGLLSPGVTPGSVIRAMFPGGTITGCPKVRCMEIIQALEQRPRGAYTGSFGYLNRDGRADFNILIRTLVQHQQSLELCAGSGIVADSEAARELDETRAKAKGMLIALESAHG